MIAGGGGSVVNTMFRTMVLASTPPWRHGEPADVDATVALRLSDLSAWTTSQVRYVDGGTTMRT